MRQAVNLVLNLAGILIVIQIVLDFLRDRRELRIDRAEDSYFLLLLTDNLLLLGLSGMIQLLSGRAIIALPSAAWKRPSGWRPCASAFSGCSRCWACCS